MATLYEHYNTGDVVTGGEAWGSIWHAMTFTTGTTKHTVTSVKLKLYRNGLPGTVTVSIRATSDGTPTGGDLTSGTTNGDAFTTDTGGAWYEITMPSYDLSINTMYAIVVRAPSAGSHVTWRADGSFTSGKRWVSVNSGSTWTGPYGVNLYMFEVWGETINNPPSAPTSLLCEGATDPVDITDVTPEFSAIYNDPDAGDTATHAYIQVNTASDFLGTTMWDSGWIDIADISVGSRCGDISITEQR